MQLLLILLKKWCVKMTYLEDCSVCTWPQTPMTPFQCYELQQHRLRQDSSVYLLRCMSRRPHPGELDLYQDRAFKCSKPQPCKKTDVAVIHFLNIYTFIEVKGAHCVTNDSLKLWKVFATLKQLLCKFPIEFCAPDHWFTQDDLLKMRLEHRIHWLFGNHHSPWL